MQSAQGAKRFNKVNDCISYVLKEKGLAHFFRAGLPARVLKIGIGQSVIFQVVDFWSRSGFQSAAGLR